MKFIHEIAFMPLPFENYSMEKITPRNLEHCPKAADLQYPQRGVMPRGKRDD
jgi:hypothetical protein